MPRMARRNLESGFFHIMVQGIKKEEIFIKDEYKKKYIQLMHIFKEKHEIEIVCYCVMNNHVHIIIYSENIDELTKFMMKLNTTYAVHYNKSENRVGYVYRNRFESKQIYNQDYLTKCIKYIHMNPVKAEYVKEEKEYKYSSYNDYINKTGIVNNNLLEKIFNSKYEYLKSFLEIEYDENLFEDIEINETDLKDIQNEIRIFIEKEDIPIEELREDKRLIRKLYKLLDIKISKAELARQIGISRSKLSKIINEN